MALAQALGPRKGRFDENGVVQFEGFNARSRGYAVLGVFMLWFGWWGFNGGSLLAYKPSIAHIILNTNIAAAAAGISSYAFACLQEKRASVWRGKATLIPEKTIGGVLGGLVAITACCYVASVLLAMLVGLAAGICHNLIFDWLMRSRIDDPVGAFPVHTGCGILGTLCVALAFFDPHLRYADLPASYSLIKFRPQFGIQLCGVLVAGATAYWLARLWLWLLDWLGRTTGSDMLRAVNLARGNSVWAPE